MYGNKIMEPRYGVTYIFVDTMRVGFMVIDFDGHTFQPEMIDALLDKIRESNNAKSHEVIIILNVYKFEPRTILLETQENLRYIWGKD